jgi:rhodanese-related sulfurtransferase
MVRIITALEMQALLAKGEVDVVDIRNDREWSEGHIPGARAVTLDQIRANPDKTLPRSNIIFVCGQGLQSLAAAKLADRLGITQVYNLDGGINGWTHAGLQLVTG